MKNIGWLLIFFALFSCHRNNAKNQLSSFYRTEVHFPENLHAILEGRDTLLTLIKTPIQMVVWYDSTGF